MYYKRVERDALDLLEGKVRKECLCVGESHSWKMTGFYSLEEMAREDGEVLVTIP